MELEERIRRLERSMASAEYRDHMKRSSFEEVLDQDYCTKWYDYYLEKFNVKN